MVSYSSWSKSYWASQNHRYFRCSDITPARTVSKRSWWPTYTSLGSPSMAVGIYALKTFAVNFLRLGRTLFCFLYFDEHATLKVISNTFSKASTCHSSLSIMVSMFWITSLATDKYAALISEESLIRHSPIINIDSATVQLTEWYWRPSHNRRCWSGVKT